MSVGEHEGKGDGIALGAAVGRGLGALVGARLGEALGFGVGEAEGGVGAGHKPYETALSLEEHAEVVVEHALFRSAI